MIAATQIRPGMVIKFNGELYSVFTMTHRTPGNLRGFVQVKMRNLRSGSMNEHRFASEDKVEKAQMDEHKMEYMYNDSEFYYFMNTETYEQVQLAGEFLGDSVNYLIDNLPVVVTYYDGRPISVEPPPTVDLRIVETEPSIKGASVSNVGKQAKLETGMMVTVPQFIEQGEKIRINTAEGTYMERA
ncbi:elongation factor P [Bryobacter aggregatus]|uniref:elongation factor P n=1 Tax=Bryobacter aggregatus TaxID=360054 RepID=UPI0004E27618|nr:elongation factor P [Bryobacter aggregatus]